MSVCIVALRNRKNKIDDVVFELISKAREFSAEISVILPVGLSDYRGFIEEFNSYGIKKVFIVQDEVLSEYNSLYYSKAILDILKTEQFDIVLVGATSNGRDLAPKLSANLRTGLTADCTELKLNEQGKLAAIRPTFGGSLMATILCSTLPQMATIRPGVFKKIQAETKTNAAIEVKNIDFSNTKSNIEELEFIPKTLQNSSIADAQILLAGGKGLKTKENFEKLYILADLLNAKVAATRAVVEAGWCQSDIQVGQTGQTVTPKVYVAFGISGALQHIEGIKGAQKIIAINTDKNAPIVDVSDFVIFEDAVKVINNLLEEATDLRYE